ncbi:MAG: AMP-dependent synthetase/ligase [Egibacteraceae bacterium]
MWQASAKGRSPAEVREGENVTTVIWERAARTPDRQIIAYRDGETWQQVTWSTLAERVERLAAGLIAEGVGVGDRVALMSSTRVEWTYLDLAILAAGGVTVPIYETSSTDQCAWILEDSGACLLLAETADQAKRLDQARPEGTDAPLFVIEDGGLDALAERGGIDEREQVADRAAAASLDDPFSIIYTSGTTGRPKGCVLTHRNLLFTARQTELVLKELLQADESSTLMFLPLAHVLARLIQYVCLESDTVMGYAGSIETLADDLKSFKPVWVLSVPRVFEKIFNGAQRKAEGPKRKVFDFAVANAQEWSAAVDAGRDPGLLTKAKHQVAKRLVYAKLREALGGRIEFCVSGGAPLAPYLAHFFHAAGIDIYEGYGLTETTAPATVNSPRARRIGTVGTPLPGMEVAIADDGEIMIRGDSVFTKYWNNEEAGKEILLEDGWCASGDLGEIADGFLRVTGRKKEMIVTAGGKNVAPAVLEERIKANRLVSQVLVVGEGRPFVGALITLEPDEVEAFAREHDLGDRSMEELAQSDEVRAELDRAVQQANDAVSQAESVRQFAVLPRDLTVDDGELTPSLKVRRHVVLEHFPDQVEQLYERS